MLLFDSLHMASSAMGASQLGIQVAGQNFTNANTPGYVREQLILEADGNRRLGNGATVGNGVNVNGVVQVIDRFLEERLRNSTSDAISSSTQYQYYTQLETLLGEFESTDLSTSIEDFFNSIDNVLNQPENVTYRKMAVDQGEKLAEGINRISLSIVSMQRDLNTSINRSGDEINRLLREIDEFNTNITKVEAGNNSEALGLRDQRLVALSELATYINIKTVEDQSTGKVAIYCGSNLLLSDGVRNEVSVLGFKKNPDDVVMSRLCVGVPPSPLDVRGGKVFGYYEAHQNILGKFAVQLDDFAAVVIREFNKVYTSGQGLTGYSKLSSIAKFEEPNEPISNAGLDWPVVNGGFNLQVYNNKTGTTTDHFVKIEVNPAPQIDPFSLKPAPLATGTSIVDIATSINQISGISAEVDLYGKLMINADNANVSFSFGDDTSGALAALGLNTFFTGNTAASIGVNAIVIGDPNTFAVSKNGVGKDTKNGEILAAMGMKANPNIGGMSISGYYEGIVVETMLAGGTMKSIANSDLMYQDSLQAQRDSISGVNIDEETIMMMTFQRMFQANSKLVAMIDEMLRTLVNL
ncbi:MAG: flagellar hook-associated protein FlgK [Thermoguttaceae bacterium]